MFNLAKNERISNSWFLDEPPMARFSTHGERSLRILTQNWWLTRYSKSLIPVASKNGSHVVSWKACTYCISSGMRMVLDLRRQHSYQPENQRTGAER